MSDREFFLTYLHPYGGVQFWRDPSVGFVVWRMGTGGNCELLHIRAVTTRKGYGRELVYRMLDSLQETPPYYSVFGFTRTSNDRAAAFYEALGFRLQPVEGLYKDGHAVMFWQSFEELVEARRRYNLTQSSGGRDA